LGRTSTKLMHATRRSDIVTRTSERLIEPSVVRATILFQLIGFQALDQVQLAQCTWTSRGRQISFVLCTIAARAGTCRGRSLFQMEWWVVIATRRKRLLVKRKMRGAFPSHLGIGGISPRIKRHILLQHAGQQAQWLASLSNSMWSSTKPSTQFASSFAGICTLPSHLERSVRISLPSVSRQLSAFVVTATVAPRWTSHHWG
jgi:hypothetical protein